jgi:hypothetical protein
MYNAAGTATLRAGLSPDPGQFDCFVAYALSRPVMAGHRAGHHGKETSFAASHFERD